MQSDPFATADLTGQGAMVNVGESNQASNQWSVNQTQQQSQSPPQGLMFNQHQQPQQPFSSFDQQQQQPISSFDQQQQQVVSSFDQQQQQQQPTPQKTATPYDPAQYEAVDDDFFGAFSNKKSLSKPADSNPDGNEEPDIELMGRKKYTSTRSVSSYSSRSTQSGTPGLSPLLDPGFAPPPEEPLSNKNSYDKKSIASQLPSYNAITHSGTVMARISLKSLILRQWKQIFWITYGLHKILFFRTKSDFEEWLTNPYLNKEERGNLIKAGIDLKCDIHQPGIRCFRTLPLRFKEYGKRGMMYTFKLEQWMYYGPIIIGAFASNNKSDTKGLYTIIREIIKTQKSGLSDTNKNRIESDAQSYHSNYTTKSAPTPVPQKLYN